MTLDKILLRASVSEIANTLIPRKHRWANFSRGNILQYKLGYMNYQKFQRIYEGEFGYRLWVSGVPDKIDLENGRVHELKVTYNGLDDTSLARSILQLQMYLWLTGLRKGCLDVYKVSENKLYECYKEVELDMDLLRKAFNDYALMKLHQMATHKVYRELVLGKNDRSNK